MRHIRHDVLLRGWLSSVLMGIHEILRDQQLDGDER